MEAILNFAKSNYIVLLVIGGVLVVALIGYFYDKYQNRDVKIISDGNAEATMLTESTMQESQVQDTGHGVNLNVESPEQPVQTQQSGVNQ